MECASVWNWRSLALSAASARLRSVISSAATLTPTISPLGCERMPVGHPEAFFGLVGALAGDLDAGDGIAGAHDRGHDAFDRVRQRRHAVSHIAPEMVLNGDAADFGEALVDLDVAAVGGEEGEADRRGVVDQLRASAAGLRTRTPKMAVAGRSGSRVGGRHWLASACIADPPALHAPESEMAG